MDYPPPFYITEHDLAELRILSKAISIKKKSRIVKFKRTRLRERIFEFIALNYSISAPDLTERFPFSKRGKIESSNAKESLCNLNRLELIQEIDPQQKILEKKGNSNKKKYYKLTSKGIYFRRFLQSRIMELIFTLSLVYKAKLPTINILEDDQNFIKQLNVTKVHFDR